MPKQKRRSLKLLLLKDQGYTLVEVKHPVDGERLMKNYYTVAAGSAGIADFMARQKLKDRLNEMM